MPLKGLKGGSGVKPLGYGLGAAETEETEPHFNQTVLLLHADGSEGEGNTSALGSPNYKAFRDNSTSVHAITVNGDAYGNDFSPYYYADGYWSVAFDEASDIQIAHSSEFNAGTGAFTLEGFVYVSSKTNYTTLYSQGYTNAGGILIQTDNNTSGFRVFIDTSNRFTLSEINLNEWVHIAIVRDGSGNLAGYINGVQNQTATGVTDDLNNTSVVQIGKGSTSHYLDGYISNLRFIKGTAKYQATSGASNFTVPTTPFTDESGTSFLVCQSNRFMDNSTTGHTLTTSGAPKVSTNTPFTQSKTANVGSGFFDGSGDGLTTATSSDFAFGTNNFTFECWVYPFSKSGTQVILDLRDANDGGTDHMSALVWIGSQLDCYSGGNFSSGTDLGNYFFANSWNHVAVQRSGNNLYHSVNGIVSSTNPSFTRDLTANGLATIGGNVGLGTSMFTGYIADMRVVNGTAVYGTSDFTVPTSSLTAVTNTKLLTTQYSGAVRNVGFLDDSKYNHRITRNGDVSLGTFSPFSLEDGYWSRFSDSSTNSDQHGSGITLGTNNFTIGMFVYPLSSLGSRTALYADTGANTVIIAHDQLLINAGSVWTITIDYTTDIVANQWQWLQIDRTGSTFRVSIDGSYVDGGGATSSGTIPAITTGTFGERAGQADYTGYFSNFILINGANRGSIATPTSPLTADSDTALLLHQSNRYVNNGNTSVTLTSGGDNKILPFSPLAPSRSYSKDAVGGSGYFDGTGDRLTVVDGANIGTGDFTISAWVYRTSSGTYPVILDTRSSDSDTKPVIYTDGSTLYYYTAGGTRITGSSAISNNTWIFIRLVKESNVTKLFVNGTQVGSDYADTNNYAPTNDWEIGSRHTNQHYWYGYIANFDITLTALSGTTVPTAPTTSNSNTLFLVNFTNAGIIDHTMKNILLEVGDTRITTTDKKFGTGSLIFDGSDYIQAVNTEPRELFTPATGDMTWECFVKFDILDGDHCLFSKYGSGSEYQFYYSNSANEWRLSYHATTNSWSDGSVSTGTWYHIALVKDGTTVYLFKNGTSLGTNTMTYNTSLSGRPFVLGASFNGYNSPLYQLKGKLDEVRVTRLARYTSNFTAPTKAFANR